MENDRALGQLAKKAWQEAMRRWSERAKLAEEIDSE